MGLRVGLLASTGKHLDCFFVDIADEWRRQGWHVEVASGSPGQQLTTTVLPGLTPRPGLTSVRGLQTLRAWAREHRLDVIVTNTANASALARLGHPTKVIYFCHGLAWNSGTRPAERLWRAIERGLLARTDGVITMNSDDRAWFQARTSAPLLYLSSGVGVPDAYLAPRVPLPDAEPLRLLWVGDYTARKRPLEAVRVAQALRDGGQDFRLQMLGDGPLMEETRSLVAETSLGGLVDVLGRVGSVLPYIDSSHLMLHTSGWEGLPRALLEGAARGRRAVAYDVKGVRDIPGVLLVDEGRVDRMTEVIALGADHHFASHTPSTVQSSRQTAALVRAFVDEVVGAG